MFLDFSKTIQAWVFNNTLPCILYKPGMQASGDRCLRHVQLPKRGGWKPCSQPARSCQPWRSSHSTGNFSTQLSRNNTISVLVSIGIRAVGQVLGGRQQDIVAAAETSTTGKRLLCYTRKYALKKDFCPTAFLVSTWENCTWKEKCYFTHFSNEKWKHKPQQLVQSLSGRLEKSCKLSPAPRPRSSPCSGPRPPWAMPWATQRHPSLSPTNIQAISKHGNSHYPDQNMHPARHREWRTQNSTEIQLFRLEMEHPSVPMTALWESGALWCYTGPLNRTVLPLRTACMLNSADKGIYFHILGEYQYLSFMKKKWKITLCLMPAWWICNGKSPSSRRIGLKWAINIGALQLCQMLQYLNE